MRRIALLIFAAAACGSGCTHEYFFGEPDADHDAANPDTESGSAPEPESDTDADTDDTDDDTDDTDDGVEDDEDDVEAAYVDNEGELELHVVQKTGDSHCTVLILEDSAEDGDSSEEELELPAGWSVERYGVVPLSAGCSVTAEYEQLDGAEDFELSGHVRFDPTDPGPTPCEIVVDVEFDSADPPAGMPDHEELDGDDLTPDNCE